jgi:cytochrome c oxidase assembly protein subunit 15
LPPLSAAEWERVFAIYRQIPEYTELNQAMTLAEFKTIFWWEYIHRLWGRLIGLVFLVPFLWFLLRGRVRRGLASHLVVMFLLGGAQGALGWYMVASGFSERTDVSQYRLVAHLGAAVAIYIYILWVAFGLLLPNIEASPDPRAGALRGLLVLLTALALTTLVSGGFVAGTNAGLVYNTFPLMDGAWLPSGYRGTGSWIGNLFENEIAVQFNHRLLATATAGLAFLLWLRSRRLTLGDRARRACDLVLAMTVLQFGLGVATLLLVVPVGLAALHQAGALGLVSLALWAVFVLRPAPGAGP